jgi:hypothetical protein
MTVQWSLASHVIRNLRQGAHPFAAVFGAGIVLSMLVIMWAEILSSPPRASPAIRAVVVAGSAVGSLLWAWGVCVRHLPSKAEP